MTFPANDLEALLLAASEQGATTAAFVEQLFLDTAWFPMTVDASGAGSLTVITLDNKAFIPLFTSQEQATQVMGDGAALVEAPVRDFLLEVPTHLGVAVNPSGDLGLPIFAEAVQHALHRSTVVSLGARVRLGEPADEPTRLLQMIGVALGTVLAVRDARRVWAQVDDDAPGLVIGIDVDPDNADTRLDAVAAVGSAQRAASPEFAVDVVFSNDRSEFTAWMTENAAPFYRA